MNRTRIAAIVGVVGLVAVGGVGAVSLGLLPGDGGGSPPPMNGTDGGGDGRPNGTDAQLPVAYAIENSTECGRTCRVLTSNVTNLGNESLGNVTLAFVFYAGDDRVWQGTTDVGSVAGNATERVETRVDVGMDGGLAIRGNDGYVTIRTTVRANAGERTFQTRTQTG